MHSLSTSIRLYLFVPAIVGRLVIMTVCTLASSSSGNCTIVSHGGTHILIDAGISLRRVKERLNRTELSPADLACVLVTHEHTDHISGIEMLIKYYKTPIFSSPGTGRAICCVVPESEPFLNCLETGAEFEFGDFTVSSFRTPHDASESVGYTLRAGGKRLVYVTDLGCVTPEVMDSALGADIAIIEANHDCERLRTGAYPDFLKKRILSDHGHLSNSDSGDFAARLALSGSHYIQLAHLSRENNTPELACQAVGQSLRENGITAGKDVELDIAPPDSPGRMYKL